MALATEIEVTKEPEKVNTLNVDFGNKRVFAELTVYMFSDHGHRVSYVPALNLSAYGKTDEESLRMLTDVVLVDFYDNILDLPRFTAFEYLGSLGWQAGAVEQFSNDAYVDKDGVLRSFQLPEDTLIEERFLEVA